MIHVIILENWLPRAVTITDVIYCQQLRRLAYVMLVHDNYRPHCANHTKNTLQELGWEVIPHLPYSPDLVPQIFTFSALYRKTPRNFLLWVKMCCEHGLTTSSTQNHAISTGAELKNYSSVGRLL